MRGDFIMKQAISVTAIVWVICGLAPAEAQDEIRVATMPPVVVKTVPQSGDTDVDPATTEIRVTFSKDMMDKSWSWTTISEDTFPEMIGKPRYLADKRTCVLGVKLEPGRSYGSWINSAKFGNFKDTEGRSAVPYLLVFETREGQGTSGAVEPAPEAPSSGAASDTATRKWADSSGTFSVEAEMVDFKDGKVSLKKTNGKVIIVPLAKLSEADQEFVRQEVGDSGAPDGPATVSRTDLTGEPRELEKDDGEAADKKSFPRGHAVAFEAPEGTWYLSAVRIHGARYGHPQPPKEDFHITLCDEDFNQIADFPFPYKRFERGPQKWITLRTKPTQVPARFVICANFNAERTKGVYVSHDAEGTALVGLPGRMAGHFNGGDWLIRAQIDQLKDAATKGSP
jgi:RNA polymerase sigma-70 factor (ECF subfamily)